MNYTRDNLLFLGRMNVHYHESMELVYGRFLNWTSFASLLLSSAAFAAVGSMMPETWKPYRDTLIALLALGVTALNAAVLAFGMYGKFITHTDLKKDWIAFLGALEIATDDRLPEIERQFNTLNAREPAPNRRLLDRAHDKTREALGWVQPTA
ncbi:MAG: hypothetical protein IPK09_00590 [Candidatus Competibacteraceae bacterium]|nr:hypothetical protein [Candidatus Competibacteraceae bacterium]